MERACLCCVRAHDRGQDTRVPSAVRSAKAEARAGETHTGSDTPRGGEGLSLAERGAAGAAASDSIQMILLLLQWW